MEEEFAEIESQGQRQTEPYIVIVLDTDPGVRWALEKGLQRSGYDVRVTSIAAEAMRLLFEKPVSVVIMELLPEAGFTLELLTSILESPASPKVICVSIDTDPQMVIDCVRHGATDFLPKPFSLDEVRSAVARALASEQEWRMVRRSANVPQLAAAGTLLIGISPPMQELRNLIQQVAKTNLNCLIRGESGTGKDLVAREIHRLSARKDKPFIKVNCSALPEHLLESELFGYEKGAFTGATFSKPGRFELANHGVIFLDEVADIQPNLQAKLLQVIEHKEFTKLGGRKQVSVDVQILAATNANLEQRTQEGSFRHDLYFRLNEVCIWVPSLSSRKEDIPLLVRHFIQKHAHFGAGKSLEITAEDLERLAAYPWPGNVRELESMVKRWLAFGKKIYPEVAPSPLQDTVLNKPEENGEELESPVGFVGMKDSDLLPKVYEHESDKSKEVVEEGDDEETLDDAEIIVKTLERCKWNRKKAAEMLGMSYQKLRRRIQRLNLDKDLR